MQRGDAAMIYYDGNGDCRGYGDGFYDSMGYFRSWGIVFTTERAISVTGVKAFTMREDTIALGAKASMTHMGIWSTPIEKLN